MKRGAQRPPSGAPGDEPCIRLIVRGRVQGVWYRGSAREEAQRLGLRGWARNRADGSVEILAKGPPAAIERFVAWSHEGPPLARVTSVEREEHAVPAGDAADLAKRDDFEVR